MKSICCGIRLTDKVIFQFIVCYTTKPSKPPNAVDLAMDLLLSRPANTAENRPITNLITRISVNTTATSKKVKICTRRLLFCSNLCNVSRMI